MTTKSAFSTEEWKTVLEGPPSAGMIVITAAHGGTFRETFAMSKAYVEERGHPGETELVDEIAREASHGSHPISLTGRAKESGVGHLRDAVALLARNEGHAR